MGVWIADASFTPDPDPDPGPGTGDYSWPYEPTPGHWVTSEYGPRSGRFHEGMDFSGGPALLDKPIPAIGDGTVQQSGLNGAFGYSVILHHGSIDGFDWKSLYAHQPSYASRPGVGATITKGQQIGLVNNTGSSFGSHLHFEIHRCSIGGGMRWDNGNPSYSSSRTAYNPRNFFSVYGDGTWIIS
jgi:murein DD-endopeptidase MepM/ murein hydrolase activator NlpD